MSAWTRSDHLLGSRRRRHHHKEGAKRVYHHTAPINTVYTLFRAVELLLKEGEGAVFERHRACHERLVRALESIGLSMLNAVIVPEGVDEAEVRSHLRSEHKIEICAGLGPLAGKIW